MDPFEEFEFKPLTKGLGFHKKPSDMEMPARMSSAPSDTKDSKKVNELNQIMSRIPAFDTPVKIDPILPREEKNYPGPTYRAPKFKNTEEMLHKQEMKFEPQLPKHEITHEIKSSALSGEVYNASQATHRKEVPMNFGAMLFDVLVAVGLLSLFTGVTLAITDSDFAAVWANAQTDLATRLSLILLAFTVVQVYLILSRSFFGATLGEWAFEITLGSQSQQKSALYPLQVTWRSFLVAITGFIPLPFLGMIFGKDLVGRLSGVRLGRDI